MNLSTLASTTLIAMAAFAPVALADGRKPGSKLCFPVHRSGDAMFTIVNVTNTNVAPMTPTSFGGSTNLHFEYYNVTANPANAFRPFGCTIFDRVEFMTPADTLSVLTACHNAAAPGGQEGYVVVTAQDPSQSYADWCFNHLVGSEIVVSAGGVMYSLNAHSLRCYRAQEEQECRGLQACNGVHYESLPRVLMADSFIALSGAQLALISGSEQETDVRHLYFEVWNDNELPLSTTLQFSCWFDQPLTSVSPLFANSFLASTPNAPDELDINCDDVGDVETGWFRVSTLSLNLPLGGRSPSDDLGILGAITTGRTPQIDGARLLWESPTFD